MVLLGNATKLGNKEASQYTTKDRFAVLTGTMIGNNTEDLSADINFPGDLGFNSTNCVVISSMLQNQKTQNKTWGGVGSTFDSASYVRGTLPHSVFINSSGVHIEARNILINNGETPITTAFNDTVKFDYKIVLMRID